MTDIRIPCTYLAPDTYWNGDLVLSRGVKVRGEYFYNTFVQRNGEAKSISEFLPMTESDLRKLRDALDDVLSPIPGPLYEVSGDLSGASVYVTTSYRLPSRIEGQTRRVASFTDISMARGFADTMNANA